MHKGFFAFAAGTRSLLVPLCAWLSSRGRLSAGQVRSCPVATPLGQGHTRQFSEFADEPILKPRIECRSRRRTLATVIPVTAGNLRGRIVTDGEPGLGEMPHFQIVRSARAAHLGGYPTWIDG